MKSTLTKKIAIVLLLPFLGSVVGVIVLNSLLNKTRVYFHSLSVASQQSMLAASLPDWVHMIALGQEEDRAGLRSRVEEFEWALVALRKGGQTSKEGHAGPPDGQPANECHPCHARRAARISPAPAAVQPDLAEVASLWDESRRDLLTVAEAPIDDSRFIEAYRRVEGRLPELQNLSQKVVMALAAEYQRQYSRLFWTLIIVTVGSGVLFLVGLLLVRRHVNREAAAHRQEQEEHSMLEDMLRSAQKMEAIGRLTGGIAHDFNNLLGIINGYSELSLNGLKDGDPLLDNLKEIQAAGERAAALTHQLLAFRRKQILQPKVINLNDVIGQMERMLRRLIGEDIDLATFLEPGLGQVKADPGQMEQVIMNLAVNARDAMPEGGKLTIETKNVVLDRTGSDWAPDVQEGRYVMMAISDTGTGMDAKTMEHIFEPFFTTKEKGKGTGLGLSTVHGIVKQSGGHVSVYSEPERGTSVKVYLPRIDEEKAESSVSPNIPTASLSGSETILVVEDEERLRKLVCRVLREKGYTVLEASSGQEALRASAAHKGPIHLLATDVVMPELSGRETADILSLKRPETRVLYMSGYTDEAIVRHGILEEGVQFLPKPFTPEALARKVREVLG